MPVTPEYIPVPCLGTQTFKGQNILKAARIWYRALSYYFSTHGTLTNIPSVDESTFRTLRSACVKAAADLFNSGSAEHCNTILAFYAVGLHPKDVKYGADVTFLRWGVGWDLSRKYVGLTSPNYSSRDLFINNGGTSEWNAVININHPNTGQPTQYENTVYCRVRNVGDQPASNVQVEFHYAKAGTATWTWLPVVDKNGNAQQLTIGTLGAGQSNFPDSAQNSPPASASVKWCIPPLANREVIDHYCLKAKVSSSNDVNPHNNEVQSNIAYTAYSPPAPAGMFFLAGNPYREDEIPLELKLEATLPKRWAARISGVHEEERLKPGEDRLLELIIDVAPEAGQQLEPPLDGDLVGEMRGDADSKFTGSLTDTELDGEVLVGQFTALLDSAGTVCGRFEGAIGLRTGEVKGQVVGNLSRKPGERLKFEIFGCLRPWRRVDVSQWHEEEPVGGITVQVQVPWEQGPCTYEPPPTDTRARVTLKNSPI